MPFLKRAAPLKRSGFARKVYERTPRVLAQRADDVPLHRGVYGATAGMAAPKRQYVRSRQLLYLIAKVPYCMLCQAMRPVVPAHSNWAVHGKGKGIKADDNRIAALCGECHMEIDQGNVWTEDERKERWWRAHVATVFWILAHEVWPAGVPVPSTAHNPFTIDPD